MNEELSIYEASDYAGLRAGEYEFYYGYEGVICEDHGYHDSTGCPEDEEKECEWAFVARKNGGVYCLYGQKELSEFCKYSDSTAQYLLAGIAKMIAEKHLIHPHKVVGKDQNKSNLTCHASGSTNKL